MANWIEFVSRTKWQPQEGGGNHPVNQITFLGEVDFGDRVILYEKRGGFLKRKLLTRHSVEVLDNASAILKIERALDEPRLKVGSFVNSQGSGFGLAVQDYSGVLEDGVYLGIFTVEELVIKKQDIWIPTGRNRFHGLLWTDNGRRIDPIQVHLGRSYYSGDTDDETSMMFAQHYIK